MAVAVGTLGLRRYSHVHRRAITSLPVNRDPAYPSPLSFTTKESSMTDSPAGREPDPNMNLEGLLSDSGLGGLQDILEQARTSLAGVTVDGGAGGGAVRVSMSAARTIG